MWFNKKKEFLIDQFQDGIVDIHNHILPGLDDGSPDFETTVDMIHLMRDCNISEAYVTPHIMEDFYDLDTQIIAKKFEETKNQLDQINEKSGFLKDFSSEYMIDSQFSILLENKELRVIDKNYLLTELSYFQMPNNLEETIFKMTALGYKPILAHPERYRYIEDYDQYQKWKNQGFLFQLNLLSLSGHYGQNALKKAHYLLSNDLYDFVGTDAHNTAHLKSLSLIKLENKVIPLTKNLISKHQEVFK
ncbi:MAG: CpsB/CapC family capsule biosynthesis tyrosine phosphatase [Nonlabens sp.]